MVDSRSSGCHGRARHESPLLCTPSANEVPIDLDRLFHDGEEGEDVGSPAMPDVVDDSPVPIGYPTYPQSSQPVRKKGRRVLACFPLDLASAGPVYSDTQLLAADLWGCDLAADPYSNMAPTDLSLTSFVDPFNGISATERDHLPHSKTGQYHLETLISPKTTSTSSTTGNSKPSQNLQSLGFFTGYATSEEEEEQERVPVRPPEKAHPKKSTVYKSAEVIARISSSDSDLGHSQSSQFPLQRTTPAKLSKHLHAPSSHRSLTAGKPNRDPLSKKRSKMTYDRRGNGNGSASKKSGTTSQKRPRSPTAMIANKRRPNTKGGFVVDDSESEVEDQHIQIEDENDIRLKSVSSKPLPKQPPHGPRNESKPISMMQHSLGLEPGVTPLPTKQVNRSRINALLGKNKGAQNTPKQSLQLTQARSSNTTPTSSALPGRPSTASAHQHRTPAKIDDIRTDVIGKHHPPEMQRTTKGIEGLSRGSTASETPGSKLNIPPLTAHQSVQSEFLDSPQTQRNKPIPGASVARERAHGMASNRPSQASPPKSLLQATLDDARHATTTVIPGQTVDARGGKYQDVRNVPSALTTSITQKSEHGPHPRTGDRHIPSSSNTQPPRTPPGRKSDVSPVTQSMSKNQTLGAISAKPTQPQHQRAGGASVPKTPQPNARSGPAQSSRPKSVQLAQPAQKRKADTISGGPGHAATLSKRPAVAHARPPVRSTNTQAQPKGAAALTAADSTPKALGRNVPTAAEKPSTSTRPAADEPSSSRLAPSPISKTAINESCSIMTRHDPIKQQDVHAAAPAHRRTSLGTAKQTQIPPQQEAVFDVIPANSTPQKPRPASDKALPGQATPLVPQKGPATGALTSSNETPAVGAAPSFDQSTNDRIQASVNSSGEQNGEGSYGEEFAQDSVSTNTSKPIYHAAIAMFPNKSPVVPITPSNFHEQREETPTAFPQKTISTVTPGATSSVAHEENDETNPGAAACSIPTKPSDATKPASTGLAASAKSSNDQSFNLLRSFNNTMEDPTRCNVISLEARKKSEVSQEDKDKATPNAAVTTDTTSNAASTQIAEVEDGTKASPDLVANSMSFPKNLPKKPKVVLTPPLSPSVASANPTAAMEVDGDTLQLSHSPEISNDAQPYFEYSVFQKMWSGEQIEKDVTAAEVTVCSFTNIDEANAQAERLFQGSKDLYAQYLLVEWSNKRDEYGCSVSVGTIAPFDYPGKKSHLKIYVQRNCVSKFANQTPQTFKGTGFISSTGYALRLFKLISTADAENSDDSDAVDDESETRPPIRAYELHSRPEYYTTREAANRAARSLQIELSHEKNATDVMTKAFQEKNLAELNAKVLELESPAESEHGCWKSKFNASGLGGDSLELVVVKAEICGPRNI